MDDERWDFYFCRVDDAPASIFVALHETGNPPPPRAETLHVVGFEMRDAGDHGMGIDAEAETLWPVEEALVATLRSNGLIHVGRLRGGGTWQVSFYGPSSASDAFLEAAATAGQHADRKTWTHVDRDPDWSYFRSFLLPDFERRMWMRDRAVVDALADAGDALSAPRPVTHVLEFPSTEAAELFLEVARMRGHDCTSHPDGPREDGLFEYELQREDRVELEYIHRVVMDLVELAAPYDGDHVGWRAPVVTSPAPEA